MNTRSNKDDSSIEPSSAEANIKKQLYGDKERSIRTRSDGKPTCLYFGANRRNNYPGSEFCSNCDWLEDEFLTCNKRVKLGSARYHCRSKHDNWVKPSKIHVHEQYSTKTSTLLTSKTSAASIYTYDESESENNDDDMKTIDEESSEDDYEVTLNDLEELKQNLQQRFSALKNSSEIAKNKNKQIKEKYASARQKLQKECLHYKNKYFHYKKNTCHYSRNQSKCLQCFLIYLNMLIM